MSKTEKLLAKARRQPAGLSFDEFKALLVPRYRGPANGSSITRRAAMRLGTHYRLPIQPASSGKAKGYQVKQFLRVLEEEESDG